MDTPPSRQNKPLVAVGDDLFALLHVGWKAGERHKDPRLARDVGSQIPRATGWVERPIGYRIDVLNPGILGGYGGLNAALTMGVHIFNAIADPLDIGPRQPAVELRVHVLGQRYGRGAIVLDEPGHIGERDRLGPNEVPSPSRVNGAVDERSQTDLGRKREAAAHIARSGEGAPAWNVFSRGMLALVAFFVVLGLVLRLAPYDAVVKAWVVGISYPAVGVSLLIGGQFARTVEPHAVEPHAG